MKAIVFSTPSRLPSSFTIPETAFTNGVLSGVTISVNLPLSSWRSFTSDSVPRASHIGLGTLSGFENGFLLIFVELIPQLHRHDHDVRNAHVLVEGVIL